MSESLTYPVPFDVLARDLTEPILRYERADVGAVYRAFVRRMNPAPVYEGLDHLPDHTRFIVAANHYQRKGLWIAHAASALAFPLGERYGVNPPVRYVVTANWPRWRLGPLTIPSPGDILLPRVAHAVWCYAVPFAGTNPLGTARSLRRLVKEAESFACPIGLFPEGAEAIAGRLQPPLAGIGRFLSIMAANGWDVVPAGIAEDDGLIVRIGAIIASCEIRSMVGDPAGRVMDRIAQLARGEAIAGKAPLVGLDGD